MIKEAMKNNETAKSNSCEMAVLKGCSVRICV